MNTIILMPRDGHDLPPMQVSTDREHWPKIEGKGETLNRFQGIGTLRQTGYDVSPIKGHGTVYEVN